MDKKYNRSSLINGKTTFDFVIYYLVILYYDLHLVLNYVASNGLKVTLFEKFLPLNVKERAEGLFNEHH